MAAGDQRLVQVQFDKTQSLVSPFRYTVYVKTMATGEVESVAYGSDSILTASGLKAKTELDFPDIDWGDIP